MSVYDGAKRPEANKDPSKQIQWEIQKIAQAIGVDINVVITQLVDAAKEAIEESEREVWATLIGWVSEPGKFLEDVTLFALKLLNIDSGLPAWNLFGQVPSATLGHVSLSSISNTHPILLANPIFDLGSVAGDDEWVQDSAVTRDPLDPNAGSVYVVANGAIHELYSNSLEVDEGDRVTQDIDVQWSGLAFTGTKPFTLRVAGTLGGVEVDLGGVDVFKSKEMAGNVSPASNGGWVTLSGEWVVPAGVDHTHMVLAVAPTATAGTIRWSYPRRTKQMRNDIAPIDWTFGLQPALTGLEDLNQDWVDYIYEAITGIPNAGADFNDFYDVVLGWFDDTQTTAGQATDAQDAADQAAEWAQDAADWALDSWNWTLGLFGLPPQGAVTPGTVNPADASIPSTNVEGNVESWNWLLELFGLPTQTTVNPAAINQTDVAIPPANVIGAAGMPTIEDSFQTMWNQFWSAFGLAPSSGNANLSDVSTNAQNVAQNAVDANALATDATNILNQRTNVPTYAGMDNTSQSNMPITGVDRLTGIVNGGSTCGIVRIEKSAKIGAITFIGQKNGAPAATNVYANVYKANLATNTIQFIWASPNITPLMIDGTPKPRQILLPTINNFDVVEGDIIFVEFSGLLQSSSSNTGFMIVGVAPNVANSDVHLMKNIGYGGIHGSLAVQETINRTLVNPNWDGFAPYISLDIITLPPGVFIPEPTYFGSAGNHPYVIPSWAKFLDMVCLGGGDDSDFFSGGAPGSWNQITLTLPTGGGVVAGDTLTVTVGAGGTDATLGGNSLVKKGGTTLLTANGGNGSNFNDYGGSPGSIRYNNVNYYGGAQVWLDAPGNPPGGGAGKTSFSGINGAPGGVWLTARSS